MSPEHDLEGYDQLEGYVEYRVVVGVDGSDAARAAAAWAIDWARHRHLALTLLHVVPPAYDITPLGVLPPRADAAHLDQARERLPHHLRDLLARHPDVNAALHVVEGIPAHVLVAASARAALTVVGTRGLGAAAGLLLGSVSDEVVTYAEGPVAVVNADAPPAGSGRLVVGVDGGCESRAALTFAAEAATDLRCPLVALHAIESAVPLDVAAIGVVPPAPSALAEAAAALESVLEPYRADHPGLDLTGVVEVGTAYQVLRDAPDASGVVVGNRGHGAWARLLLGSTSRRLAQASPAATIVVRTP